MIDLQKNKYDWTAYLAKADEMEEAGQDGSRVRDKGLFLRWTMTHIDLAFAHEGFGLMFAPETFMGLTFKFRVKVCLRMVMCRMVRPDGQIVRALQLTRSLRKRPGYVAGRMLDLYEELF